MLCAKHYARGGRSSGSSKRAVLQAHWLVVVQGGKIDKPWDGSMLPNELACLLAKHVLACLLAKHVLACLLAKHVLACLLAKHAGKSHAGEQGPPTKGHDVQPVPLAHCHAQHQSQAARPATDRCTHLSTCWSPPQ